MAYFLHLNFHIRKRNLWNQLIVQIKIYLCKKIHEIKILPFEAISNKKGVIRFLEEHFGSSPSILSLAEFFLLVGDFEFFCKSFNKFFGGISSIVTLNDESSSESSQRKKIGEIKIHMYLYDVYAEIGKNLGQTSSWCEIKIFLTYRPKNPNQFQHLSTGPETMSHIPKKRSLLSTWLTRHWAPK